MTDEQLAVVLRDKKRALEKARDEMWDMLPEGIVEKRKDFFGHTYHYSPVLGPVEDVINDLNKDIEALLGGD